MDKPLKISENASKENLRFTQLALSQALGSLELAIMFLILEGSFPNSVLFLEAKRDELRKLGQKFDSLIETLG